MTRINLVPVEELSDQHLIAEYHELPRCIKQPIDTSDASETYILGKGHMKWAKRHTSFLIDRYFQIYWEMLVRGFKPTYTTISLITCAMEHTRGDDLKTYSPTEDDISVSRNRLIEKYSTKPDWYRWTKRNKPSYMEVNLK